MEKETKHFIGMDQVKNRWEVSLHSCLRHQLWTCIAEAIVDVKVTNAMSNVIPSYFLKHGDKRT